MVNSIGCGVHASFTGLLRAGSIAWIIVCKDGDAASLEFLEAGLDHAKVFAISVAVEQELF